MFSSNSMILQPAEELHPSIIHHSRTLYRTALHCTALDSLRGCWSQAEGLHPGQAASLSQGRIVGQTATGSCALALWPGYSSKLFSRASSDFGLWEEVGGPVELHTERTWSEHCVDNKSCSYFFLKWYYCFEKGLQLFQVIDCFISLAVLSTSIKWNGESVSQAAINRGLNGLLTEKVKFSLKLMIDQFRKYILFKIFPKSMLHFFL